jgi:hypothetical protein
LLAFRTNQIKAVTRYTRINQEQIKQLLECRNIFRNNPIQTHPKFPKLLNCWTILENNKSSDFVQKHATCPTRNKVRNESSFWYYWLCGWPNEGSIFLSIHFLYFNNFPLLLRLDKYACICRLLAWSCALVSFSVHVFLRQ